MTETISLTIDGVIVNAPPDATILKAAASAGVAIPTICYHEYCTSNALCRICVVEVEGSRTLVPACVARVSAGMQVKTRSERVIRARRTILELLASTVDLSDAPEIQAYLSEYGAHAERFSAGEQRTSPILDDNPMYIREYSRCILCWRCVQVCAEDAQYTYAINFSGRGFATQIGTFFDRPMPETACVFCGQCVAVCPTGALKPKRQWLLEQGRTPQEIMSLTPAERRRKRREISSEKPSASGG